MTYRFLLFHEWYGERSIHREAALKAFQEADSRAAWNQSLASFLNQIENRVELTVAQAQVVDKIFDELEVE